MQQTDYMMSQTAVSIADNTGSAKAVFYLSNQRAAYCVISDPANAPRYTFSTKEYLSDAGLYLYQYRVYDPQAGRWTQRDPIDYEDSINLYQFCGNNPVNHVDDIGLMAEAATLSGLWVAAFAEPTPFGEAVVGLITICVLVAAKGDESQSKKEHRKNKRESSRQRHERGRARANRDSGGERGDARRPYRIGGRNDVAPASYDLSEKEETHAPPPSAPTDSSSEQSETRHAQERQNPQN